MNDVSSSVHAKDLRLMTNDQLIAEISRLRAAVTTYGQHLSECQLTQEGHITAIVLRGDTEMKCTCGFEALNAPEKTESGAPSHPLRAKE